MTDTEKLRTAIATFDATENALPYKPQAAYAVVEAARLALAVFEKAHTPASQLEYYDPARQDSIAEHDCVFEEGTWWFGHGMECKHPELHTHTPTDDEREALIQEWANVHQGPDAHAVLLEMLPIGDQMSLALRDALRELAGLRRSEVPEPRSCSEAHPATAHLLPHDERLGEPSDAQVNAAAMEIYDHSNTISKSGALALARAALRAAGAVQGSAKLSGNSAGGVR